MQTNRYGQPIGDPVPGWQPRPRPDAVTLAGSYCRLERLDPNRHPGELFDADRADLDGISWTYLPYGPFEDLESYCAWVSEVSAQHDPYFFAVIDTDPASPTRDRASAVLSLLRVQPDAGSIEVGHHLLARAAADPRVDRGAVHAHELRLRRPQLPTLRMEVRRPQCAVPKGGRAARVHL